MIKENPSPREDLGNTEITKKAPLSPEELGRRMTELDTKQKERVQVCRSNDEVCRTEFEESDINALVESWADTGESPHSATKEGSDTQEEGDINVAMSVLPRWLGKMFFKKLAKKGLQQTKGKLPNKVPKHTRSGERLTGDLKEFSEKLSKLKNINPRSPDFMRQLDMPQKVRLVADRIQRTKIDHVRSSEGVQSSIVDLTQLSRKLESFRGVKKYDAEGIKNAAWSIKNSYEALLENPATTEAIKKVLIKRIETLNIFF